VRAGRQKVTGVVVNAHTNPARRDYDHLKAILHSAVRDGGATANRDGHPRFREQLRGRIAWVAALNPRRAQKLYKLWTKVDWDR
jgi:hypothetical protein